MAAAGSFKHVFARRGYVAEARRWRNPNGSEGGIVALSAAVPPDAVIPASAEIGPDASLGREVKLRAHASVGAEASIGDGARIGEDVLIGDAVRIGSGVAIQDDVEIHSRAAIGDGAEIGPDTVIEADAVIGPGARIGACARIGAFVQVGRDAQVEDLASVEAGARIGDGARIEAGVAIKPHVRIEKDSWFTSLTPLGPQDGWATAVYDARRGLRWWTASWRGITTPALVARIRKEHGGTDREADYLHAVRAVTESPGLARAMAGGGRGPGAPWLLAEMVAKLEDAARDMKAKAHALAHIDEPARGSLVGWLSNTAGQLQSLASLARTLAREEGDRERST
jgi:acyl-[acyl carrier protein]--UDP-N-acetylglucosamine O-acyltransferase